MTFDFIGEQTVKNESYSFRSWFIGDSPMVRLVQKTSGDTRKFSFKQFKFRWTSNKKKRDFFTELSQTRTYQIFFECFRWIIASSGGLQILENSTIPWEFFYSDQITIQSVNSALHLLHFKMPWNLETTEPAVFSYFWDSNDLQR